MTNLLLLLVFPALVAYSAVSDLLRMTISNRVTIAIAGSFFVMALLTGMPLATIGWHVAAGAFILVITFTLFALGWIGGGDAKMAAAVAMWIGFDHLFSYFALAALLGGALTLLLLKARSLPLPEFAARQAWIAKLHHPETGVPYGIALAAAALLVYPHTAWLAAAGQ